MDQTLTLKLFGELKQGIVVKGSFDKEWALPMIEFEMKVAIAKRLREVSKLLELNKHFVEDQASGFVRSLAVQEEA